jgi:hypothetical protein
MAAEIWRVREVILGAADGVAEQIKWNAPSFGPAGQDRVTMRLHPKGFLQLIFHRGAKVRASDDFSFADDSGLLEWVAKDRAIVTFTSAEQIAATEADLSSLVARWLQATSEL